MLREADNLEVLAIVLIMKKAKEVFRSLIRFPADICCSVNYHEDADSETTGSDDGFQGVDLEVAERTSGTYLTENGEN